MPDDGPAVPMLALSLSGLSMDEGAQPSCHLSISRLVSSMPWSWEQRPPQEGPEAVAAATALPFGDRAFGAVDLRLDSLAPGVEDMLIEVARVVARGGSVWIEVSIPSTVDRRPVSSAVVQLAMRYLRIRDAGETDQGFYVLAEGAITTEESMSRKPSRVQRLERALWRAESQRALSEWKLESIRERRWWRLGSVLAAIRKGNVGLGRGIRDLIQVIREPLTLPPRPFPPPEPDLDSTGRSLTVPLMVDPAPIPSRLIPVAVVLTTSDQRKYEYEWHSIPLTPESFADAVARDRPELLFVSSDALVGDWLTPEADAAKTPLGTVLGLLKERGVPLVYWDKGGPAGIEERVATGSRFDFVFCLSEADLVFHRELLGNTRVAVLAESVQPRISNPISVQRRRGVFGLEGSLGSKAGANEPVVRAARQLGLAALRVGASVPRGVSRGDDPSTLTFEAGEDGVFELESDEARYAVKTFAAAVTNGSNPASSAGPSLIEIAATNIPIVSGPAFPDSGVSAVPTLRVAEERDALQALRTIMRSKEIRTRMAHPALRAVLASETTSDRVDHIFQTVELPVARIPTLTMMVPTNRPQQLPAIFANLARQTYPRMSVVLVLHGIDIGDDLIRDMADRHGIDDIEVISVDESVALGEVFNRGFEAAGGDYIGKMDDDDFYGPEYASDLMSAFSYSQAEIVGKWAHYAYLESSNATVLRYPEGEHSYQSVVAISTLIMKRDVIAEVRFPQMPVGSGSVFLRNASALGARVYSADRFNYLYQRSSGTDAHTWSFSDFEITARAEFVCRGQNIDHVLV